MTMIKKGGGGGGDGDLIPYSFPLVNITTILLLRPEYDPELNVMPNE